MNLNLLLFSLTAFACAEIVTNACAGFILFCEWMIDVFLSADAET